MSDFWLTRSSMIAKYGSDYKAWSWFGPVHLCILLVTAIVATICTILYKKKPEWRKRLEWIILGGMLLEEVWMFTISFATGQFEVGFLPLQLCGINIFFCIAYTIWHKEWMGDMLFATGIPGCLLALVVPTWTGVPVWNYIFIFSTGYHVFLWTFCTMILAGDYYPSVKRLWKVFLILLALCVPIFGLNQLNAYLVTATGNATLWSSNFMFLYQPESILALLNNAFHLTGYWYLIFLPILLVVLWGLTYLPVIIIDLIKKKRGASAC